MSAAAPTPQKSVTSSWLRRLAGLALALVLVLAAAGAWLWWHFDAKRVQGLVIDWVRTERQRELHIDGPVQLELFPRLQVRVQKVALSEHASQQNFASVQDAALSVDVMPLLDGRLVINRIEAQGVQVHLTRDAQGHMNIDDLLSPKKNEPDADDGKRRQPLRFEASGLNLRDLRVLVDDRMAHVAGELKLDKLITGKLADDSSTPVEMSLAADLSEPKLRLMAAGTTQARFSKATGAWAVDDMKLNVNGDAAAIKQLAVQLSGSARFEPGQARYEAKALKLALAATLDGLKVRDTRLELGSVQVAADLSQLQAHALKVELAGSQAGTPLSLSGQWADLQASRPAQAAASQGTSAPRPKATFNPADWQVQVAPTALDFSWGAEAHGHSEQPASAAAALQAQGKLAIAAIAGGLGKLQLPGLRLELQGAMGPQKFSAAIAALVHLDLMRPGTTLSDLSVQAQLQSPSHPDMRLNAKGDAGLDAATGSTTSRAVTSARWNLQGQLNDQALSTDGQVKLAESGPDAAINLRFDTLDLNRLLPPATSSAGTASASGPTPPPLSTAPIDLSALNGKLRAKLALRAAQLKWQQTQLSQVALDATLIPGKLLLDKLAAQGFGGNVLASGYATASGPSFALKASGQNLNIQTLMKQFAGRDPLEGTGAVELDVLTQGASLDALRAHLNGTARTALRDGAVRGINLARAMRQAKAAVGLQADAMQQAKQQEKTDFSELSASFAIHDGVAHNEDFSAKSPFLRVTGAGDIDLARQQLNYLVNATVIGDASGQDGAELAQIKGLTVPVKLHGPLSALQWQVQWSAVAKGAITAKARNKLEEELKKKLGLQPPAPASAASAASPASDAAAPARKRDELKKALKGLFK